MPLATIGARKAAQFSPALLLRIRTFRTALSPSQVGFPDMSYENPVKTFSRSQNKIVRDKLIRARRPCGPSDARAVVSQQQIAKLAHISQALLSNFETGKADLDAKTLRAVEVAIMEIGRHRASEGFRILSDAVEQGDGPKSSSALHLARRNPGGAGFGPA
jgi:transcriptional regulator with XRE-family HTH domain